MSLYPWVFCFCFLGYSSDVCGVCTADWAGSNQQACPWDKLLHADPVGRGGAVGRGERGADSQRFPHCRQQAGRSWEGETGEGARREGHWDWEVKGGAAEICKIRTWAGQCHLLSRHMQCVHLLSTFNQHHTYIYSLWPTYLLLSLILRCTMSQFRCCISWVESTLYIVYFF